MSNDAADFAEARWRRLTDAEATEQPLPDSDRAFLQQYSSRSPQGRAEAELFDALGRLGDDDGADQGLVDATVQQVLAARQRSTVRAEPDSPAPSRGRAAVVLTIAAAAAAIAATVVLWPRSAPREPEPEVDRLARAEGGDEVESVRSASAASTAAGDDPSDGPRPQLSVASGRLLDDHGAPVPSGARARGTLTVESDEGCLALGDVVACFEGGTRIRAEQDPSELVVLEGEGHVRAPPSTPYTMFVRMGADRYEVSSAVTIEVEMHHRDAAHVRVLAGPVELTDADGARSRLQTGASRGRARPSRPAATSDAKTLLSQARASRRAGDRKAAISYYERLIRRHPSAAISRASMVSVGDLYLDIGKPVAALRWFDRYLEQGGTLSQEARIGRIKALRALGRTAQEQRAIEQLRQLHPNSRYAD
ncbi:MAG: tetratricopeptide repeat protein [Nannocystaceae bacterium]